MKRRLDALPSWSPLAIALAVLFLSLAALLIMHANESSGASVIAATPTSTDCENFGLCETYPTPDADATFDFQFPTSTPIIATPPAP